MALVRKQKAGKLRPRAHAAKPLAFDPALPTSREILAAERVAKLIRLTGLSDEAAVRVLLGPEKSE